MLAKEEGRPAPRIHSCPHLENVGFWQELLQAASEAGRPPDPLQPATLTEGVLPADHLHESTTPGSLAQPTCAEVTSPTLSGNGLRSTRWCFSLNHFWCSAPAEGYHHGEMELPSTKSCRKQGQTTGVFRRRDLHPAARTHAI